MNSLEYNFFEDGERERPATEGAEPIKNAVLAMAYVPMQQLGVVYSQDRALEAGTLFPDLEKPFTGRRNVK